ncbi:hypothetical protein LPJ57_009550, partial [Coemansia sp. RSA 486]
VVKNIRREFPAVSESCMSNKDAIINENEDMRFAGLAHTSLTRQIMTNIMLGSMFSENSSEASSSGDEDEDEDDSEMSAPFSIWEFGELENVEEYIDDHYSDQSSSSGDSGG